MRDMLKNPFLVFLAGLILLWLIFKVLKIVMSSFGLIVLAFIVLYAANEDFRHKVQSILKSIFR